MTLLTIIGLVFIAFAVLAILATAFGTDSRPGLTDEWRSL